MCKLYVAKILMQFTFDVIQASASEKDKDRERERARWNGNE